MMSGFMSVFLVVIGWVCISEAMYIFICKYTPKEDVEVDWVNTKCMCMFCAILAVAVISVLVTIFQDYPSELLIGIIGLVLIGLIFYSNKYIGIWVSIKPKPKPRKSKSKKRKK